MAAPACLRNVVAVEAAYDANVGSYSWRGMCTDATAAADRYACWSNTSEHTEVVASGCKTLGAEKSSDSATSTWCGTSRAAPHVAAVAALIEGRTSFLGAFELEHCLPSSSTLVIDASIGLSFSRVDVVEVVDTCDFNFVSLLLKDAKVKAAFKKTGVEDDKLVIKGLLAPASAIDLRAQAVSVKVADADGETFSAAASMVSPTWVEKRPGFYRYKDKYATQSGVKSVVVDLHPKNPLNNANGTFKFKAAMKNLDLSRLDKRRVSKLTWRFDRTSTRLFRPIAPSLRERCRAASDRAARENSVARVSVVLGISARRCAYRPTLSQALLRFS